MTAADPIRALHAARLRFGSAETKEKLRLLDACATRSLRSPGVVRRYHETLLYMAAHPDDRRVLERVTAELQRVADATPAVASASRANAKKMTMTGLAGSTIETRLSLELLEWLVDRYPDDVEIAWGKGGSASADLDEFLWTMVLPVERDSLHSKLFTTRRWVRFVAGESDLAWILRTVRRLAGRGDLLDHVYDALDIPIRWRVPAAASRTLLRFPERPHFFQHSPLKRSLDAARLIARPLPDPESLGAAAARRLVDTARTSLALRDRETDPVTHANPREVTLFRLERGVDVALFGTLPARRLPLESYFGFVAARNRVPVAYGGAWIFDRRAEIGVHLFDTFRGGESALLFTQVMRTYRQHFDVHRFEVPPYQFGADNAEAIRTGAFWFYHRLGFRPTSVPLRATAEAEWARLQAGHGYRTPSAVLRRFTKSPMAMTVTGRPRKPLDLTRIGIAVTATIARDFAGDREAAAASARRHVGRLLQPRRSAWSAEQRAAFDSMCPLVSLLPGLDRWPARDRRTLAALMRAKGGIREGDYVRAVQRHPRFADALEELTDTIDWSAIPVRRPPDHVRS